MHNIRLFSNKAISSLVVSAKNLTQIQLVSSQRRWNKLRFSPIKCPGKIVVTKILSGKRLTRLTKTRIAKLWPSKNTLPSETQIDNILMKHRKMKKVLAQLINLAMKGLQPLLNH